MGVLVVFVLALQSTLLKMCAGFEMAAPLESCATMYPHGHGTGPQENDSPYTITVNATSYEANDVVEGTCIL